MAKRHVTPFHRQTHLRHAPPPRRTLGPLPQQASPDAHNAYVASIDTKFGGKVKPLIRFIKAWKYFRDVPISSFYLEREWRNMPAVKRR